MFLLLVLDNGVHNYRARKSYYFWRNQDPLIKKKSDLSSGFNLILCMPGIFLTSPPPPTKKKKTNINWLIVKS